MTRLERTLAATFPDDPNEIGCDDLTRLVRSLHPTVAVLDFEVIDNKTFAAGTDEVSTAGRIVVDVDLKGDDTESVGRRSSRRLIVVKREGVVRRGIGAHRRCQRPRRAYEWRWRWCLRVRPRWMGHRHVGWAVIVGAAAA